MRSNVRSWLLAGVLGVSALALGSTPARAQGFGYGGYVATPGVAVGVSPGYGYPYGGGVVVAPPVVVRPPVYVRPPIVVAPPVVVAPMYGPRVYGYGYGGYGYRGYPRYPY